MEKLIKAAEIEYGETKNDLTSDLDKIMYKCYISGTEFGAKWQAERSYSEEDMISFMQFIISNPDLGNTSSVSETTARYYLEQFKKK